VNGTKISAYKHNSTSPSTPNAASPFAPEIILTRVVNAGSMTARKEPASRRYKRVPLPGGRAFSVTLVP
jgi:hypothetical protein